MDNEKIEEEVLEEVTDEVMEDDISEDEDTVDEEEEVKDDVASKLLEENRVLREKLEKASQERGKKESEKRKKAKAENTTSQKSVDYGLIALLESREEAFKDADAREAFMKFAARAGMDPVDVLNDTDLGPVAIKKAKAIVDTKEVQKATPRTGGRAKTAQAAPPRVQKFIDSGTAPDPWTQPKLYAAYEKAKFNN